MAVFPQGMDLGRSDVIGRKLVDIRQDFRWNDNGLDWAYTFFCLDSGATFCLPLQGGGGFCVETLPPGAGPFEPAQLELVLGQRVTQVLEDGPQGHSGFDSPFLLLENGYAVTDVMAAHHGLGFAGLHVFSPGEIDLSKMVDFFH